MEAEWDAVKEVFGHALELEGGDRSRYMDEACSGRPELRAEVERLLHEAEAPDGPLAESSIWKSVRSSSEWLPAAGGEASAAPAGRPRAIALKSILSAVLVSALALGYYSLAKRGADGEIRRLALTPLSPEAGTPEMDALAGGLTASLGEAIEALRESNASLEVIRGASPPSEGSQPTDLAHLFLGVFEEERAGLVLEVELVAADGRDLLKRRFHSLDGHPRSLEIEALHELVEVLDLESDGLDAGLHEETGPAPAYRAYLMGEGYLQAPNTVDKLKKSIALLRQSLSLQVSPFLAYRALCEALLLRHEIEQFASLLDLSRNHCSRAAALKPDDRRTRRLLAAIDAAS